MKCPKCGEGGFKNGYTVGQHKRYRHGTGFRAEAKPKTNGSRPIVTRDLRTLLWARRRELARSMALIDKLI